MDVFHLRDQVIDDYSRYMRSFIEIADPTIAALVEERLRALWPEPLLQLNPAFEPGQALEGLIADGHLHPACRDIFQLRPKDPSPPQPLRLYRHQVDGILAARAGDNYVLTTGTGSGKSLSYIVPIVDHVLRARAQGRRGIQAIVVYPMNALANSQREELSKYLGKDVRGRPVSFERYTGQESHDEREAIRRNPPDILLTNYVMLELILTRPEERPLVECARDLRFLVFDELHTYRGRQGADVAMLCRRVRDACAAKNLIHVGTSATLASEGTWDEQRRTVAEVASTIFGAVVEPRRVIGETLRRLTPELDLDEPSVRARLRERVAQGPRPTTTTAFIADPLASWIESTLGIQQKDGGRLVRQRPRPLGGEKGIARELARLLDLPVERCDLAVREALLDGYAHTIEGRPVFAFRLHQFIAKGDTVYASLDPPGPTRHLTLEPQLFVPGSDKSRSLLPLCFCRECGQEFYTVRRVNGPDGPVYAERDLADNQHEGDEPTAGFLLVNTTKIWPEDNERIVQSVPESWVEEHKGKLRVRSDRKPRLPRPITVSPLGVEGLGTFPVCFIPAPFLFCPSCGVAYDARQHSDFGKLGTLGSEGRSTATTILSLSTLRHLRRDQVLTPNARKLLSFTDNRQDAALQAGHFNDFVSLGLVRSGLYRALESAPNGVPHDELPQRVFDALDLPMRLYAQNPEVVYGQREATQRALRRVLGYNLYRDLARGWRLTSPNLEQCGLVTIEYRDLDPFCADPKIWGACHSSLQAASPALRRTICEVLLNNLRRELAIYIEFLDPEKQEQIRLDANQLLIDPWCLGDADRLVQSFVAVPGSTTKPKKGKPQPSGRFYHVSSRGGFGQFLRRSNVLGAFGKLNTEETQTIIEELFAALKSLGALHELPAGPRGGTQRGYQLAASSMIWRRGDGEQAARDPIRVPQTPDGGLRPNAFFKDFYRASTRDLAALEAREHTAQVRADEREVRERRFREAELPLLFCSPTMELGVDIAELNVVNMRNVPPTPANYAQRSGRAGRSGQPAFVYTYCAAQSPHDHFFFRHPERMVAGEVTPPRLDLQNEDLLRAHVHAIWLAESGLQLGSSLSALLDVAGENPTLEPQPSVLEALADPGARARTLQRAQAALGDAVSGLFPLSPAATEAWLAAAVDGIPQSFARACGRWISLYRAAHEQARRQRAIYEDRSRPHQEREQARRLAAEADAQLDLLASPKAEFHSDFYSYRYFASEGFLPGYNFPRLPLSAYLPGPRRRRREDDEFLSRPRFLAISEFGPRSIIYHEGSRFVIGKVILGAEAEGRGREGLCTRALRCTTCGAVEPLTDASTPDLCPACGAQAGPVDLNLFRMRNVTAHRRDRITSDEEERLRIGYDLRTNVHFPAVDGQPRRRSAELRSADGELQATLTYGHAADVWRINLGWRRRKETEPPGFLLDTERGIWVRSQNPEDPDPDSEEPATPQQLRVIPYVEDTRNCLLVDPAGPLSVEVMASLQAALKSAIQIEFQLEDRELAAEPLPARDDRRRILLYEAAEGGAGVLRRLVEERDESGRVPLARVARQALELCHFDPDTGEDRHRAERSSEDCEAACYDCLLSYFNQPDHRIVDRKLLRELLMSWSKGQVHTTAATTSENDPLTTLLQACESELERRFLRFLDERGHRLPTKSQVYLAAADTRVDFLYTSDTGSEVAVYVDGPPHDALDVHRRDIQQQEQLEDVGYLVLRFKYAEVDGWHEITARYPSVFGTPTEPKHEPARETAPPPKAPPPPVQRPPDPPLDLLDPLADLLDLFDDPWHPLVRQLAALPRLSVDAGGDLGDRVAAQSLARLDRDDRSLFLVDAGDPLAAKAIELLVARRRKGLLVRPDVALSVILAALDG